MRTDVILRIGTKVLLPFMLVFALYVQFHADYGPGGGFQAGVIAASAVILLALVFGLRAAKRIAPTALVERMVPAGVLIYAGTGAISFFGGHNFLDYAVLGEGPHARELGILLVELGVLTTVTGTMIAMFYAFVERGR